VRAMAGVGVVVAHPECTHQIPRAIESVFQPPRPLVPLVDDSALLKLRPHPQLRKPRIRLQGLPSSGKLSQPATAVFC
jgi:hypothetical protein